MDISKNSLFKNILKAKYFPFSLQIIMLIVFILLIIGGIGISTSDSAFAKILRNTNLANLIVWSFWWPLIIYFSIFMGRIWCMVCPVELINSGASIIGLRKNFPSSLQNGWTITIFYILTLILGLQVFYIHRLPHRMALYLLLLTGIALLVGLIFRKRSFCNYICPVGHLLGLYARIAPLEWRIKDESVCNNCKEKPCISVKNENNLFKRSCTSNLYPAHIQDNTDCILCTQCMKTCQYDNITLRTRKFFRDLFLPGQVTTPQMVFILALSGFVIYEIGSEWNVSKAVLLYLPVKLNVILGIDKTWVGNVLWAASIFLILPFVLWFIPYALIKLFSKKSSLLDYFRSAAITYIPVMGAAHLIKGIQKMSTRLDYIPLSLNDPKGVETAAALVNKTMILPDIAKNFMIPVIDYFALICIIIGIIVSIIVVQKKAVTDNPPLNKIASTIGAVLYGMIFLVIIVGWRFLG